MINYVKDKWYENNVRSLGLDYLCGIFEELELIKNYSLLSGSANRGLYEQELYRYMEEEYNPTFDIGDLFGEALSKSKVKNAFSINNFTYYPIDRDVKDFNITDRKYDIILDIKGALWHYANDCNISREAKKNYIKEYGKTHYKAVYKRKKIIQLLEHYLKLMKNDNSKLIIDNYYTEKKKYVKAQNSVKNLFDAKYNYFVEFSTYEILCLLVNLEDINNGISTYHTKIKEEYPLTKYMSVGVVDKATIIKIITSIENQMDLEAGNEEIVNRYTNAMRICSNKSILKYFVLPIVLVIVIIIVFFVYFM